MTKRAFLIIGLSEKDVRGLAKQKQACLEWNGERWNIILESEIVSDHIKLNQMHPLCATAWLEPIRSACIVDLLIESEKLFEDDRIDGILIGCTFAIDRAVRNVYTDILKEQGYEVEISYVQSPWLSSMYQALESGDPPLPSLVEQWNKFNNATARQYSPLEYTTPTMIVSKGYGYDNEPINSMIKALLESGYEVINLEAMYSDEVKTKPEHIAKIDTFWRKVANHYNVQLVYETDPVTCHHWRIIGVPCISLTNPFALKFRV